MSDDNCKTCNEYAELSRRKFMGLSTGLIAAAATPAWLPRVVLAESESSGRDVIVSIFLRGGADALSLCVPHGDRNYYELRNNTAIQPPDNNDANRAIDLDGFFGFPPALQPLVEAYRNGDLAVVHASGLPDNPTRSHFDAMAFMESGQEDPPPFASDGWLGRHLRTTAPSDAAAVVRAIGIGFGLQRTLVGAPQTLPIADLAEFNFPADDEIRDRMRQMHGFAPRALKTSAENTFHTIDLLERIDFRGYRPAGGASYPGSEFGVALSSTAALIKAEIGVEAVAIDIGGWDTHTNQGPVDGYMSFLMRDFATSLAAFHQDLFSDSFDNVVVTTMSEFGRNSIENGSRGTDHGHGGLMFVMGGAVNGGRVITDWPGLAPEQLYQNQDLAITVDYRDVLMEVLGKRAENSDYQAVFPDESYSPREWGVIHS